MYICHLHCTYLYTFIYIIQYNDLQKSDYCTFKILYIISMLEQIIHYKSTMSVLKGWVAIFHGCLHADVCPSFIFCCTIAKIKITFYSDLFKQQRIYKKQKVFVLFRWVSTSDGCLQPCQSSKIKFHLYIPKLKYEQCY